MARYATDLDIIRNEGRVEMIGKSILNFSIVYDTIPSDGAFGSKASKRAVCAFDSR